MTMSSCRRRRRRRQPHSWSRHVRAILALLGGAAASIIAIGAMVAGLFLRPRRPATASTGPMSNLWREWIVSLTVLAVVIFLVVALAGPIVGRGIYM
jgi:hypothetical protein